MTNNDNHIKRNIVSRPKGTGSKQYQKYKDTILLYRAEHKKELRDYMKVYMRNYRKSNLMNRNRGVIRSYLTGKTKSPYNAEVMLGCDLETFAKSYNMSTDKFSAYVKKLEIDHIVSIKWIEINFPKLIPYVHRFYNLQFVTKQINCAKQSYVDPTNATVVGILCRMQLDLYRNSTDSYTEEDFKNINNLLKKL